MSVNNSNNFLLIECVLFNDALDSIAHVGLVNQEMQDFPKIRKQFIAILEKMQEIIQEVKKIIQELDVLLASGKSPDAMKSALMNLLNQLDQTLDRIHETYGEFTALSCKVTGVALNDKQMSSSEILEFQKTLQKNQELADKCCKQIDAIKNLVQTLAKTRGSQNIEAEMAALNQLDDQLKQDLGRNMNAEESVHLS